MTRRVGKAILPVVVILALGPGLSSCLAPNANFSPWGATSCNFVNYDDAGSGTLGDPYQICSPAQMQSLANTSTAWTASFELTSDIDMNGVSISQPIGGAGTAFGGTFDGQGHAIVNFQFSGGNNTGLFGISSGTIENLKIDHMTLSGSGTYDIGAISSNSGVVTNVHVTNSTITASSEDNVGALIGINNAGGNVTQSSVDTSTISGDSYVGGLIGTLNGGSVSGCMSGNGTQVIAYEEAGGLTGHIDLISPPSNPVITNSFSGGSLSTSNYAGGLVGDIVCTGACSTIIQNSYSTVTIMASSGDYIGGLVGELAGGLVSQTYAAGSITASGAVSGLGGLVGNLQSGSIADSFSDESIIASGSPDFLVGAGTNAGGGNLSYISSCSNCTNSTSAQAESLSDYESPAPDFSGYATFASPPWAFSSDALPTFGPGVVTGP